MKSFEFKVDSDIKNEFLDSKPTSTAKSNSFVLDLVDQYEHMVAKEIYYMSYPELREMIAMQFKNSSIATISKNVSIMRKYVDFCISKNLVPHMENRLVTFTVNNIREFVSKQALEYRYITPEELRQYQNMLANEQDVALLELPYVGVRGRTEEGATNEEIINLQFNANSNDYKNNLLKLVKNNGDVRYIEVSDRTMQIIEDAYKQEVYLGNNGEEIDSGKGRIRNMPINKFGNYVFRIPGKNKNELFNPVLINSRMRRIQQWVGNRFLTIHSLYMSGMITMAKEIYTQKGELTTQDYIDICERYDYGTRDVRKYYVVLKDIVEQYI